MRSIEKLNQYFEQAVPREMAKAEALETGLTLRPCLQIAAMHPIIRNGTVYLKLDSLARKSLTLCLDTIIWDTLSRTDALFWIDRGRVMVKYPKYVESGAREVVDYWLARVVIGRIQDYYVARLKTEQDGIADYRRSNILIERTGEIKKNDLRLESKARTATADPEGLWRIGRHRILSTDEPTPLERLKTM